MSAHMRHALDTRRGARVVRLAQARVDGGLRHGQAGLVVDQPADAMRCVRGVARPQRVGVVGEGPRGDAQRVAAVAVAAEAVCCVEDDGGAEIACVRLFVPVSAC